MIENDDVKLHSDRKWISFDPTIHMGHIVIVTTFIVGAVFQWCTTQYRISLLEAQNSQRIIDNNYLANIESDHHKEVIKQLGDMQNDVTLILTQAGGMYDYAKNHRPN